MVAYFAENNPECGLKLELRTSRNLSAGAANGPVAHWSLDAPRTGPQSSPGNPTENAIDSRIAAIFRFSCLILLTHCSNPLERTRIRSSPRAAEIVRAAWLSRAALDVSANDSPVRCSLS